MSLEKNRGWVDILVGLIWGDEGKGSVVDYLAHRYKVVARFNGSINCGHTVIIDGKKFVFHQLPSAALHDEVILLIGPGCIVDLQVLYEEMETLKAQGYHPQLKLSDQVAIILPQHRELDAWRDAKQKLGTTQKGNGPAATDRYSRIGINLEHFYNKEILLKRFTAIEEETRRTIIGSTEINPELWYEQMEPLIDYFSRYRLGNTPVFVESILKEGGHILCEGAQAAFLDILHGNYPYVTSGHCLASFAPVSLGFSVKQVRDIFGVAKAYNTRVGEGPFITENHGEWGKRLQELGLEKGASTGRVRRCGALDLPMLRQAILMNGITKLIITKLDVLGKAGKSKICHSYMEKHLNVDHVDKVRYAPGSILQMQEMKACFSGEFPEFEIDSSKLPEVAKHYLEYIERNLKIPIAFVKYGPERDEIMRSF